MTTRISLVLLALSIVGSTDIRGGEPVRVFIRAGVKTHGPGQHDHPRFLREATELLRQRGALCDGGMNFPTADQLRRTDVLVLYCANGGSVPAAERRDLDRFLERGGGVVVIHDAICGDDPQWFKSVVGGSWEHGRSKWYEGDVSWYFIDREHPISRGASNFDIDDEIYYDLHLEPDARVLAAAYKPDRRAAKAGRAHPSVYEIVPQMWVYERNAHRAFVCLLGHQYATFELPHVRALLLRGLAWSARREADLLLDAEEKASLLYPAGGPTRPERSASMISVHPEFEITLVASEPLIEKPISIDWDTEGRLWLAETPEYPGGRRVHPNDDVIAPRRRQGSLRVVAGKEVRPARDRISFLEDTDDDGVMDRKTVFYEGLELVTSLVHHEDGVIVTQAPDIYHLRDTDGDGVADRKETLFVGFGARDSHAVVSNMRWGMDGWIYATLGYSAGHPRSGDGQRDFGRLSSGIIRFLPDGSAMEQICSKGSNTWGMDFSWDNELFFTQATSGDHINHVVLPESVLARGKVGATASFQAIMDHRKSFPLLTDRKQTYVQIDQVGGFTAVSGSTVYTGGAWPARFDGAHFLCEPTINIVHVDLLRPQGATFVASRDSEREFIGGLDLWFRPIHSRVGPDGALYVVDFYNQAVVHNDTRGPKHGANNAAVRPDRDHHMGRVWRVQHKNATKFALPGAAQDDPRKLVRALEHPNGWVRGSAHRRLRELDDVTVVADLKRLATSAGSKPFSRIHALWVLENAGRLDVRTLEGALRDPTTGVRKNALRITASLDGLDDRRPALEAVLGLLRDRDRRVRLEAAVALHAYPPSPAISSAVLGVWASSGDDAWYQSALVGVATRQPLEILRAAIASSATGERVSLVRHVTSFVDSGDDARLAAKLASLAARSSAGNDGVARAVLDGLASTGGPCLVPEWSDDLQQAFELLLRNDDFDMTIAALPLIASWDRGGVLSSRVRPFLLELADRVRDDSRSDEDRGREISSLLGARRFSPDVIPAVAEILGGGASDRLKRSVIEALGSLPDTEVGETLVAEVASLSRDLRQVALDHISRRSDWALALIDAIESEQLELGLVGVTSIHRLRTHGDAKVAARAKTVIDAIRGPSIDEKNRLIARFASAVREPGDPVHGRSLFTKSCSPCHRFQGEGRDLAPDLVGMGAHAPEELLVHILDPSRFAEDNYRAVTIVTGSGQVLDGIVARENRRSLLLRNATSDLEILKRDIVSRVESSLSIMPDGFEELGSVGLRDVIAYLSSGDRRHRLISLRSVANVTTTKGLYARRERIDDALAFRRFGVVESNGVPFEVLHPAKTLDGNNLVVLKGGSGFAKTLSSRVEVEVGFAAEKLHFLGGVAGWGWPAGGKSTKGVPAARITVRHVDGTSQQIVLRNGVEIADWIRRVDVPGSEFVEGLATRGQVRQFSRRIDRRAKIETMVLESYDNRVAPTFVSITAELHAEKGEKVETGPVKTLIVGGGASHDFPRWFRHADSATLSEGQFAEVVYTDKVVEISSRLDGIDVLCLSNNQPLPGSKLRKGVFELVESGRGLVLVHAALWYNWQDWPEYNLTLAGGGTRGHDPLGNFTVTVASPRHPVMAGVPKSFEIVDELYRFRKDPKGAAIDVLATAKSPRDGKTFPVVWTTKNPKGRIVCVTLGHDGRAHKHVAFRTILRNSVAWAAKRPTPETKPPPGSKPTAK